MVGVGIAVSLLPRLASLPRFNSSAPNSAAATVAWRTVRWANHLHPPGVREGGLASDRG